MIFLRRFARSSPLLLMAALAVTLSGCQTFAKKKPKIVKPSAHDMADQSGDTTFQAFIGRLRKAAAMRDADTLSSMMSANFGYSWAPGGEGAGVFQYWSQNNVWPELDLILREKFVPSGDFMVAPAQVTFNPEYTGYRAGLRQINGSWRFLYFVSAPPPASQGPPAATPETQSPGLPGPAAPAPTVQTSGAL